MFKTDTVFLKCYEVYLKYSQQCHAGWFPLVFERETVQGQRRPSPCYLTLSRYRVELRPLLTAHCSTSLNHIFNPPPLGSARHGSARLGSARLGSARLGSARLGSAPLGSAWF